MAVAIASCVLSVHFLGSSAMSSGYSQARNLSRFVSSFGFVELGNVAGGRGRGEPIVVHGTRVTRTLGALGVATTLTLGLLAPVTASGEADADVPPRRRVVAIVNVRRVEAGLRPLRLSLAVHTAAQRHSRDQARRSLMTHTGAN